MNILDYCFIVIYFLVGFNLKSLFPQFTKQEKKQLNLLFFYHFVITFVFSLYISANGGDSQHYWEGAKTIPFNDIVDLISRGSASSVVVLLNYFPSKILGLSFFTGNLIYSLLGFMGLLYFLQILKFFFGDLNKHPYIKLFGVPLVVWIWFLPNFHFWSSGIGKDTLLFFSIALFIYGMLSVKKRLFGIAVALFISFAIRPHITLFLLAAFGAGFLLDGNLKTYQKALIFGVFLLGFISIFNYVLQFIQLESLETTEIERFTSDRASKLNASDSSSGVDISSYPYPVKVFTFIYRPLFFDAGGIFGLVASVENLLYFIFTIIAIKKGFLKGLKNTGPYLKGMFLFALLGVCSFSLILGNLGIMMRQKNMFMPVITIFLLWLLYYRNKQIIKKQ